jgi:hypothetical protein
MRLRATLLHLVAAIVLAASAALAQERKPSVPAGRDPGGVAIALVGGGIDYTLPAVAQRLARDGEGELIGWDLEDKDRKPFDRSRGNTRPEWGGDGTVLASVLLGTPGARLVPVRIDPVNPMSLARAIAFIAQTPARIAVLPVLGAAAEDWTPFRQAAQHFRNLLIIVPAGTEAGSAYPAALGLENVLAIEAGSTRIDVMGFAGVMRRVSGTQLATAAAARSAAEILAREPAVDVAALKARLSALDGVQVWRAQK